MAARGSGAVVNTGSDLAKQPEPGFIDYGACKAALLYLTKALAKQYAPAVRVNTVLPGPIGSRMWTRPGGIVDQLVEHYGTDRDAAVQRFLQDRQMPMGIGQPADVAHAAVFLASPLARFITGAALDIGGTIRGLIEPALHGGDVSADYSSFGLQDKVAIVTGASQGIGRAIALGLAQAGAHLVLAKHPEGRQDEIKQVQAEIEQLGRRGLIQLTDVGRVDDVRRMVDAANTTFGRVDILVNNAGWTGTTPALDVTEEEFDKTVAASFKSVFFACQAAARYDPAGPRQDRQHRLELRRRRVPGPRAVHGCQGRRAPPVAGAVAGMGEARRHRQRRGAIHHRDGITQSDSRAARLQGMGDHADAAGGPMESARGSRRRGAVPLQPSVRQVVGHVLMVDGGWTIH